MAREYLATQQGEVDNEANRKRIDLWIHEMDNVAEELQEAERQGRELEKEQTKKLDQKLAEDAKAIETRKANAFPLP